MKKFLEKFMAPIIQTTIMLLIAATIFIGVTFIAGKFIKIERIPEKILIEFDRDDLWDIIEMQNKNIQEYRDEDSSCYFEDTEELKFKPMDLDNIENETLLQNLMNLRDMGFIIISVHESSDGNFDVIVRSVKELL